MLSGEIFTALLTSTLTVMAWSMLYRENFAYRLIEDIMLGVGAGYSAYVTVRTIYLRFSAMWLRGDWAYYVIPLVLGFMVYTRLSRKYFWMSRYTLALIAGAGTGVALSGAVFGNIIDYAIRPLARPWNWADPLGVFNGVVIAVGTITSLIYFTFTIGGGRKPVQSTMTVGRYFLMMAFGTTVGAAVFSNSAFIYDRMQGMLLVPYAWIPVPIAGILIVIDIILRRKK